MLHHPQPTRPHNPKRVKDQINAKMAKLHHSCLVLAIALTGVILSGNIVEAQPCNDNWPDLDKMCKQFVLIGAPVDVPSQDCCAAVQNTDIPCACKHVDPALEKKIDMPMVVLVASYCNKPLVHGSRCGSK